MNRAMLMREKVGKLVALLTERKVRVTQRGARAFVEYDPVTDLPRLVNVPYIPDDASGDYLDAIEGFLDHEVAHVLFTDHKVLKKAKSLGVGQLHNLIEDIFIEKKMTETFRGSATNLSNVGKFYLESFVEKELAKGGDPTGALMVPAFRALAGQRVFDDFMKDKWGAIEPALAKAMKTLRDKLPAIASSQQALDLAVETKRLLEMPDEESGPGGESEGKPSKPSKPGKSGTGEKGEGGSDDGDEGDEGKEPGDDGGEDEGKGEDKPEESKGESKAKSKPKKSEDEKGEKGDDGKSGTGGSGSGEESPRSSMGFEEGEDGEAGENRDEKEPLTWKEFEDMISSSEFDDKISEALSERTAKEWKEAEYLIYTTEKDAIEPLEVPSAGRADASLKTMQDRVDSMVGTLQKDLERAIAAKSRSVMSGGHRSGRLHAAALSKLTMFKDERVFRRKEVSTSKDVAVSLLVDCSGSMSGPKIQTAAYSAYGLSNVLDRMNINHEVLGFTTRGSFGSDACAEERKLGVRYSRYEPLYMPIFKEFHERLGLMNKRRFASLAHHASWLNQNVDGESVQIAAMRLSRRKEARKILIVLSDGHPACPGDGNALKNHLKSSVENIEKRGIEVLGIGIMDESVKRFYKKHVILEDLDDLPSSVMGEIKRLLMQG